MSDIKPNVFDDTHAPPNSYGAGFITFLLLGGLTLMALMVGFLELGPMKVWASLGVACAQAIVLAVFSMELRAADKQTWLIAAASLFWTFLLFLFTLTDFLTRHLYAF